MRNHTPPQTGENLADPSEPQIPSTRIDIRLLETGVDMCLRMMGLWHPLCSNGWGDLALIEQIRRLAEQIDRATPAEPIELLWEDGEPLSGGGTLFRGRFVSPAMSLLQPVQSRTARIEFLLPARTIKGVRPPVYLHLAATGEQGFLIRKRLALPLVQRGYGAVFLENPFYGLRKPTGQIQTFVRTMSDQFAMNMATIMEARSLLRWLREQGYDRLGLVGYSQGGFMSALVAELEPHPLALVCGATGNSPWRSFTELQLSQLLDWKALQKELGAGCNAKGLLKDMMEVVRIDRHPPPVLPQAAILLAVKNDLLVPNDETQVLLRHWNGADLRWIDGGHSLGYLVHHNDLRQAIIDAFHRLSLFSP